eukprot:403345612
MIKQSKRKHKFFSDLTKLRLELFYYDEKVQLATFSLSYLESYHGPSSDNKFPDYMKYFDFGKSQDHIIQESTHYRERLASSNMDQSLNNQYIMKSKASFLFREYLAPDYSEIKESIQQQKLTKQREDLKQIQMKNSSDSQPVNEQQELPEYQLLSQLENLSEHDQIFENQNQDVLKKERKSELKFQVQDSFNIPLLKRGPSNDLVRTKDKRSFKQNQRPSYVQLSGIQQRDENVLQDDFPSNSQYEYRPSLNSIQSDSGSLSDDDNDDLWGDMLYMDQLNTIINERFVISQKKLFKGVEPPSRKVSIHLQNQEDELLKITTTVLKRQSMYIARDRIVKRKDSENIVASGFDVLEPDNIANYQRFQTRGTRYERNNTKSKFQNRRPLDPKLEKLKQQLMFPSWENLENEQFQQRKEGFNLLRKLGAKLRGNQHNDQLLQRARQNTLDSNSLPNSNSQLTQNQLEKQNSQIYSQNEAQGGSNIQLESIAQDFTENSSVSVTVTGSNQNQSDLKKDTNQKKIIDEINFGQIINQQIPQEPNTALPKYNNQQEKHENCILDFKIVHTVSPQKTYSSPSSPNLKRREQLEFQPNQKKMVKEQIDLPRNTRNYQDYSKFRNFDEQVYCQSDKSFKIEEKKNKSFIDNNEKLKCSLMSSSFQDSSINSKLQSRSITKNSQTKEVLKNLKSKLMRLDTMIPTFRTQIKSNKFEKQSKIQLQSNSRVTQFDVSAYLNTSQSGCSPKRIQYPSNFRQQFSNQLSFQNSTYNNGDEESKQESVYASSPKRRDTITNADVNQDLDNIQFKLSKLFQKQHSAIQDQSMISGQNSFSPLKRYQSGGSMSKIQSTYQIPSSISPLKSRSQKKKLQDQSFQLKSSSKMRVSFVLGQQKAQRELNESSLIQEQNCSYLQTAMNDDITPLMRYSNQLRKKQSKLDGSFNNYINEQQSESHEVTSSYIASFSAALKRQLK